MRLFGFDGTSSVVMAPASVSDVLFLILSVRTNQNSSVIFEVQNTEKLICLKF